MLFVKQVEIRLIYSFLLVCITCTKGLPCSVSRMHVLSLVRLTPCILFLHLPSPPPFQQLSVGCLVPPSFIYMMYFGIFPYPIILSFSPSLLITPPQAVPLLQSWCCIYACVSLHIYVRSRFSIWGDMWPLFFWTWLALLNMLISSSIHFPTNATFHSSLWLNNSPLCKHTKFP
jgi:hypothetical protein